MKKKLNKESENFLINEQNSNENESENEDELKIGKYFKNISILEAKNTQGEIYIFEEKEIIFSLVEGKLYILNINNLNIIKKFIIPNEEILSFAYNKLLNQIICLMNISMIRIFNYDSEIEINNFKLYKTVGKIVKIDPSCQFFAICTSNNIINIYNTTNYNLENSFSGHKGIIYELCFNPIINKYILYTASEDNSVRVWNILIKKCVGILQPHTSSVRHLCLTNDGNFLISGTFDNNIFIWKLLDQYSETLPKPSIYKIDNVFESMIYFTRKIKGKIIPFILLGNENGSLTEFNLQSGENNQLDSIIEQPIVQLYYSFKLNKIYGMTSEQTFFILNNNLLEKSVKHSILDFIYPCFCQEILSIKFINNNIFVFASNDNLLKFCHIPTNKIQLFEGHSDFIMNIVCYSEFIITSSKDNTIRIWKYDIINNENNFIECETICILKGHSETVNCADLLLKRKKIVSGCKDGSIKLWNIDKLFINKTNKIKIEENDEILTISESEKSEISHSDDVNIIKFSQKGKYIASGSYDKTIKLYDNNLNYITTLKGHKRGVTDLSFSLYAKILVSCSTDKTIKIWNLNDYSILNSFEGHLSSVLKIEWIYNGTHLLSSGADGLIKFWNIKASECINTLEGHEGKIWAMDVNYENNKLNIITGGTDSKIILWKDITNEKEKEILNEKEELLNKEDELRMMNFNKEYIDAMKLSLELKYKNNFIISFKNYVNELMNNEIFLDKQTLKIKNDIELIIENRKIIDKEIKEEDILDKYKKVFEKIYNNKEIKNLIKNNFDLILEIIRDYNIKQNSFFYSQILLKILLRYTKMEKYFEKNNKENTDNILNKKRKREIKLPKNILENLQVIKRFGEKHLERLNREYLKSNIINYNIEKMKLI